MSHIYTDSAVEISRKVKAGEISARAVVEAFLDRITKVDGKTGAFLEVFHERALKKADEIDRKRSEGKPLGRLAGVPIAIKDNIHIKGELTTCSSKILENFRPPFNATVTDLLEAEDAILIGKTNLDEFAMGSSTQHSAFQPTYNPWNLKCVPGGSSGGSAVAVAARMAPLSLGSDTGGSIRQPASLCGIFGFKPTYGRVSRYGLVAFGSSLDQIGPFAHSIEDIGLIMEVMGQHDPKDSTSMPIKGDDYTAEMKRDIQGMKIGVPYEFLADLAPEQRAIFDRSIETLKRLGCTVVDVNLNLLKYSIAIYYILATAEASTNLARFDGVRYGHRSPKAETLDEVYDLSRQEGFGKEVKRRIMLGTFVLSSGYQDAFYRKAQKVRSLIIRQYREAFNRCDLIAMPVAPSAAFEIGAKKDPLQEYLEDIYTISANLAGVPAISIPAGFTATGMPVGLQLTGNQVSDTDVCRAAAAFTRATNFSTAMPKLSDV